MEMNTVISQGQLLMLLSSDAQSSLLCKTVNKTGLNTHLAAKELCSDRAN